MANYKGYTQSQYDNQSKYLNNLINSGSAGQAAWAKNELASLNSQYTPSASTTPSTGNSTVSSGNSTVSSGGSTASSGSSSNGSSSGSSGKTSGSSSSKTNYGNYTQSQYDNQSKYLNNLISQGGGKAVWAQQELDRLNSRYTPSTSSTPSATSKPITGNSTASSGGSSSSSSGKGSSSSSKTNYGNYTQSQYDNQSEYLENLISQGGGKAVWAQNELNDLNSQYKPSTDNSTASSGGSATSSSGNAFISPGSQVADDGTRYHTWGENDQYKKKDYLSGNEHLQYALEQSMKQTGSNTYDIDGHVKSLYDRIGSTNAAGTGLVTLDDVNRELERLGLSDYNSSNAIYTAGGTILPNNQYVTNSYGSYGSNSPDSVWTNYDGKSYLTGGDSANYVDYVNGKTGNITASDLVFNDMASNPYAQQDPAFMNQYNQALNNFYNSGGSTIAPTAPSIGSTIAPTAPSIGSTIIPTTPSGGSTIVPTTPSVGTVPDASTGSTGYQNVDDIINFVNSMNQFNDAMGGTGTGGNTMWEDIQAMLQGGLDSQKQFLANQKTQAELDAENLMRQAYVNQQLQGDSVRESLSAAGLGTSGALQSAQLGVQNNYNNSLSNINNSLQQMIASLNEAKLQALIDHTNNMTSYAYQIQNDEQDRAYRNAQLYMQQLQNQQAQQQQAWENAYRQQLMALEQQQYADEVANARNQEAAAYYAQLANAGAITMAEYQQKLRELGLI